MLKVKIKSTLIVLGLTVAIPISAHMTPNHALGLTHNIPNSWNLFEIALLISALVVTVGFLSRKQKTNRG
ncbi:MAG: hypothetical protein P8L86_02000 [Gammaproteobacteria bacterium]|nr:hypothetical protein [Gammaproteobacteria bacterium]